MKSAVAFVALAGLAAAVAAGAAGDAPLADSKQELKELQANRKGQGAPTAKDGLKAGTPSLQVPGQGVPAYTRPDAEQQARESRQQNAARKNWLIDGMARLEKEAGPKKRTRLPGDADDERGGNDSARLNPSDPAFLLKLYERQKREQDLKAAGQKTPRSSQPDAFAPFLQDWMAASPVKDQLLGDMNRRFTGGGVQPGATESRQKPNKFGQGAAAPADLGRDSSAATQSNPYLAETGVVVLPQLGGSAPQLTSSGNLPAPLPPSSATQPTAPMAQPGPVPAATDRKAPPPPLADDKKYFPQLNKF